MQRILSAIDFSEGSDKILEQTRKLALKFNARVCFLHTEEPSFPSDNLGFNYSKDIQKQRKEKDESSIEILSSRLKDEGIEAECELVDGAPAEAIVKQKERFGADLIIVGAHQHGFFGKIFSDKVSEKIIRKVDCPLMIIPYT